MKLAKSPDRIVFDRSRAYDAVSHEGSGGVLSSFAGSTCSVSQLMFFFLQDIASIPPLHA